MTHTITRIEALQAAGLVRQEDGPALSQVAADNALAITGQVAQLIKAEGGAGPISKQFLPSVDELTIAADERRDPIGDLPHSPAPGLIHRHADRVLLKLTSICAAYCRFCFRKALLGPAGERLQPEPAIDYIRRNPSIREVILSGGDPLALSPAKLAAIMSPLAQIEHLNMIRLHTRIPIVDSQRIDAAMIKAIKTAKATYLVLHCNHASELTPAAISACNRFIDNGIPMVSQSVLLRGVNDNVDALATLFYRLTAARIKPYYLHHPDRARGTGHFRVSIAKGRRLMAELRKTISGLCLPAYVLDIPGGHGKIPIGPDYITANRDEGAAYSLRDHDGERHVYRD